MTELTCQQCQQLAAELALDILPGDERAHALAHLERCTTCQDTISALTVTADRLVQLLPAAPPPAGFEQRVITALTPPRPRTHRRRIPAAAGLLAIALATVGWILAHNLPAAQTNTQVNNDAQAGERTVLYAPLTTGQPQTTQRQIGQAYLYPGRPSWIYLSLDTSDTTTSDTIKCEVIRRDGSTASIGTVSLSHGRGTWAGPAPVDRDTLDTARLINNHGHTLARAHFTSPSKKTGQPAPRSHIHHQRHRHR
jgi:hypothetical protein